MQELLTRAKLNRLILYVKEKALIMNAMSSALKLQGVDIIAKHHSAETYVCISILFII
ncbi:hypothetical protein HMPREF0496_1745 [Lentilactobacillus hilgardii ATCC 27305]|jgi:hypothetical protein|nr:hypothetical protein HMPREF0496_1745 [Lentilactobacillus hilgardii ATCC 27305]